MDVTLNGNKIALPESCSVREAIAAHRRGRGEGNAPVPCAVEVNGRLVPHTEHATATLSGGDRIEIVTLVGGG